MIEFVRLNLPHSLGRSHRHPDYVPIGRYRISTSRVGTGQLMHSHRTPLGLHRVANKIGAGWPVGTVFKSRQPAGFTWCGQPMAAIAHRILWLEGLEPGFNRGGKVDSFNRYIYLHGVGDETTIGRPASIGCVHLAANELLPLFDRLPEGTLVWITAE
jgi:lipoprotein-anchoring transpeptidase ErfK/SrfK